jgi:hypothetical protein
MDFNNKFNHLEDVLVQLHEGQWFGWSDSKNKVYANLVIHNSDYDKPTEKSLTDALEKSQSDFDAQEYARLREADYPSLQDCVHALLDDDLEALQVKRQEVKNRYPKP